MLVFMIWLIGSIITGVIIYPKEEETTSLDLVIGFTCAVFWFVYWILRACFFIAILKESFGD